MSSLIILGNINQYTFGNAIICAQNVANTLKKPLQNIFVIHTEESFIKLNNQTEWKGAIRSNNIPFDIFTHKIIDEDSFENSEDFVNKFVDYLNFILKGCSSKDLIVDVTNGTTRYKNILSTASYILNIEHQYMINTTALPHNFNRNEFINTETANTIYIKTPNNKSIDKIAYTSLTEVNRYEDTINSIDIEKLLLSKYDNKDSILFLKENLRNSIELKLKGDITTKEAKSNDIDSITNKVIYRTAASSFGVSIENIITFVCQRFGIKKDRETLGERIKSIRQVIINADSKGVFDIKLFDAINEIVLHIRNTSTHASSSSLITQYHKSEIISNIFFPYVKYFIDIVIPFLDSQAHIKKESSDTSYKTRHLSIKTGEKYYFGLDGDDTGTRLEYLFISSNREYEFTSLSKSISDATKEIGKIITEAPADRKHKAKIIFNSGDDMLFTGSFSIEQLQNFQKIYHDKTSGLTCSIGYGKTLRDAYVALKLAKATPGKNAIVGIETIDPDVVPNSDTAQVE